MAKRWFTSDLHLGHERVIELCNRPFSSVQHMNEEIVGRWNSVVHDEDIVYILGDLAMGKLVDSLALVSTLKGNKILIPGNHDRVWSGYKQSATKGEQMRRMYEDAGLTIAPQEVEYFTSGSALQKNPLPWKLCHFPTSGDSHDEDRYVEYRPTVDEGQWLIHGHVHNAWRIKDRQLNVGVDVWNFYPIVEENLQLYIEGYKYLQGLRSELNSGIYGPMPEDMGIH